MKYVLLMMLLFTSCSSKKALTYHEGCVDGINAFTASVLGQMIDPEAVQKGCAQVEEGRKKADEKVK